MGRKPLYQSIYNRLRYQILSGEWQIGSVLPPERKLAEELGVSRNTIVRAYNDLEAEALIASKMGSGRYVQSLAPASSIPSIDWQEQLHHSEQLHSYPSHMAEVLSISCGISSSINFTHGDGGKHTIAALDFPRYFAQAAANPEAYYFEPIAGHTPLREWIVSWMNMEQVSSIEQIVVTSGSQEALHLITSLLAKPGDKIAVEMPTYFGALQLFQSRGIHIIPIPMDRDGMRTDVLQGVLTRYRPKFIYTVPTYHNPTGYTLSLARRKKLLQLSETYKIPIIEDDAYRHLHLHQEPPPALKALDTSGNVIYINTFSKILFPGLRLGWIAASRPFTQLCSRLKELSITTNTFGQRSLYAFLQEGKLPDHLARVRGMYLKQSETMGMHLARLKELGVAFEKPEGGFYYWVSLPENVDVREVLRECMSHGVTFACGDMFLPREAIQPYLRLCYAHESCEAIQAGMDILANVLRKRKELSS